MRRALGALLLAASGLAPAAPPAIQPLNLGPVSAYPGALALSRDGRVAAHVEATGAVRLWDAATAQPLPGAPAGAPKASSVGLNADGSLVVTGHADGRLLLWAQGGNAPLREFRGHAGRILALDVSPDGSRLASGADDGSTQLFDLATGRRLQVLDSVYNGHPTEGVAAPVAVGFAAGGRLLLTQDWQRRQYDVGRTATLWDTAQGLELATVEAAPPNGDEALQAGAALGAGDWLLASTGRNQLVVQRLDGCAPARALGPPGPAKPEGTENGGYADALAADPLGRWVATASGEALRFFALEGGRPTPAVALPGRVLALATQADGRSLLALLDTRPRTSGPGMTLLAADAPEPAPARLFRLAVPTALLAAPPLRVAPDAQPCAPAEAVLRRQAFNLPEAPAALAVSARLTPAVPAPPGVPPLPLGPLQQLRFDGHGQLLALYLDRGDTRAALAGWALASGKPLPGRNLPRQGDNAQPPWLGMDWAVSDGSGGWLRAATGQRLLAPKEGITAPQVAADAQAGRLYRAVGATVESVTADGRRLPALAPPGPPTRETIEALAASGGRLLVHWGRGAEALFGGNPLALQHLRPAPATPSPDETPAQVLRLMLSGDGRYALATVDASNSETPSIDTAWALQGGPVGTGIALAELPANANRVLTAGSRAHRLTVWDLDRNEAIAQLPRHRSRDAGGVPVLLKAALSDDGRRVASASPDGLVRVWDLDARRLLGEARVGAEVTALAFDAAGRQLAVGRAGGQAWVLALP